jgi:GTP-binding protein
MADIPGLIEGASEGAGLGIQFLKHLQRTGLLLHLVDIAPIDPNIEPAAEVQALARELANFSTELAEKTRWLVINKIDLLTEEDQVVAKEMLLEQLEWDGPVFEVSAATGAGTEQLGHAVMQELERIVEQEAELAAEAEA